MALQRPGDLGIGSVWRQRRRNRVKRQAAIFPAAGTSILALGYPAEDIIYACSAPNRYESRVGSQW